MELLRKLNFKTYNGLCRFESKGYYPEIRPMVLEGIKEVIEQFQRVLDNKVDVKDKVSKPKYEYLDPHERVSKYLRREKRLYDSHQKLHLKF